MHLFHYGLSKILMVTCTPNPFPLPRSFVRQSCPFIDWRHFLLWRQTTDDFQLFILTLTRHTYKSAIWNIHRILLLDVIIAFTARCKCYKGWEEWRCSWNIITKGLCMCMLGKASNLFNCPGIGKKLKTFTIFERLQTDGKLQRITKRKQSYGMVTSYPILSSSGRNWQAVYGTHRRLTENRE